MGNRDGCVQATVVVYGGGHVDAAGVGAALQLQATTLSSPCPVLITSERVFKPVRVHRKLRHTKMVYYQVFLKCMRNAKHA